jgi:hypothetical protein
VAAQLLWETPNWDGEVEKEIKLKNGTITRRTKTSVKPARFETRREAVDWCRRYGIPIRKIKTVTVAR